jgi:probable F420-dependent oxidoreductase
VAVKLGVFLPQAISYELGRDIPAAARRAEDIGYDSVWAFERPLFPVPMTQGLYGIPGLPWPDHYRGVADPLVTLAIAAAVTESVELGTSVLVAPFHGPTQLARALATLDNTSDGRVVAGLGTGWSHDEYAAAGIVAFEQRGAAFDEVLDVFAAVWGPDPVSFSGRLARIAPAQVGPKPKRRIPIHLAGGTPAALRRVVRRADAWMPVGMGAAALATRWAQVRELADEIGREDPLGISLRTNTLYTPRPYTGGDRQPFQGDVEQIVADVLEHCEAAPVTGVLLDLTATLLDADAMMDVAEQLHAALRSALPRSPHQPTHLW